MKEAGGSDLLAEVTVAERHAALEASSATRETVVEEGLGSVERHPVAAGVQERQGGLSVAVPLLGCQMEESRSFCDVLERNPNSEKVLESASKEGIVRGQRIRCSSSLPQHWNCRGEHPNPRRIGAHETPWVVEGLSPPSGL